MKYIDIVKDAKNHGQWTEKTMWVSVQGISDMLEAVKDEHPELYWEFMRKQYGIVSGCHYNEKWARHDVDKMTWKDKEGRKRTGGYWTADEVEMATKGKTFPSGVTKWDVFVAYNASATDLCCVLADKDILEAAYEFWFNDMDWSDNGSATKVWEYFKAKYKQ